MGITDFIKRENGATMEEVTAVMLEATRKGMWKATETQIAQLATLHTDLVKEYGVTSSQFSSENKKLQEYISQKAPEANAQAYQKQLSATNQALRKCMTPRIVRYSRKKKLPQDKRRRKSP